MHHKIRRMDQALPRERCEEILREAAWGTLALCGADGVPYAVPVNFVQEGGKIWFHCAPEGRKIDLIRENPVVSFCVVGSAQVVPEDFSTRYESVILTGRARLLETREEKIGPMTALCKKFSEPYLEKLNCLRGDLRSLGLAEIEILDMTGKKSKG